MSLADEKVGALAKEFLYDVAKLNFSKHGLNEASSQWYNRLVSYNQQGKMYIVNHRYANDIFASAAAAVTDIWFRQPFLKTQIIIHQPFYDQSVKGMCCTLGAKISNLTNDGFFFRQINLFI